MYVTYHINFTEAFFALKSLYKLGLFLHCMEGEGRSVNRVGCHGNQEQARMWGIPTISGKWRYTYIETWGGEVRP